MSIRQFAPDPVELRDLVGRVVYREGWSFEVGHVDRGQRSEGLTLSIGIRCADAYHHEQTRSVVHYFPVPPAAYNRQSWQRWLFEQILLVEQHEACEYFAIGVEHPYAPNHGPGHDPYTIRELATDEDRRTSFRGEVKA